MPDFVIKINKANQYYFINMYVRCVIIYAMMSYIVSEHFTIIKNWKMN